MKPKAKRVPTASSAIISKLAPQRNNVAELCIKHNLIAHPHVRGLASCNVTEFDPSTYKGINNSWRKMHKKSSTGIVHDSRTNKV